MPQKCTKSESGSVIEMPKLLESSVLNYDNAPPDKNLDVEAKRNGEESHRDTG